MYPSGFQPYRNSHFNIDEWVAAGYDKAFITSYLNSQFNSYNHPNAAIEPRIPGIFQYYSVAEDELAKIFAGKIDAADRRRQHRRGLGEADRPDRPRQADRALQGLARRRRRAWALRPSRTPASERLPSLRPVTLATFVAGSTSSTASIAARSTAAASSARRYRLGAAPERRPGAHRSSPRPACWPSSSCRCSYAAGAHRLGFENWRPVLYAYAAWAVALGAGQVMIRGERGMRALFLLPARSVHRRDGDLPDLLRALHRLHRLESELA